MSRFEYLSVLISIVIALGISEMASSWGHLLRVRDRVHFYWLHAFWSLFMVVLMVQFWWGFWDFRQVESWSFPGLLSVVCEALVLVVAALVLIPGNAADEELDLRTHFFGNSRLFFVLGAALLVQLAVVDTVVGGQAFFSSENLFRVPGVVVALGAAAFRDARLHAALAVLGALLLLGFVAFGPG